jgi:hypothetical protein
MRTVQDKVEVKVSMPLSKTAPGKADLQRCAGHISLAKAASFTPLTWVRTDMSLRRLAALLLAVAACAAAPQLAIADDRNDGNWLAGVNLDNMNSLFTRSELQDLGIAGTWLGRVLAAFGRGLGRS